jgi:hypothetical protein
MALAFGPAQTLGFVMEDEAGGAALETAPRTVIEFVGDDFGGQRKVSGRRQLKGVSPA